MGCHFPLEGRLEWLNDERLAKAGNPKCPWYCWMAQIDGWPTESTFPPWSADRKPEVAVSNAGNGWRIDNADGLLTGEGHENENGEGAGNVAGPLRAHLYLADGELMVTQSVVRFDHVDRFFPQKDKGRIWRIQ